MNGPLPTTPRPRPSYAINRSPANTPSISSSVPFDWEAARSRAPPPYASPLSTRPRKSVGTATSTGTPRKGIVRKKGVFERIRNLPAAIAFEIALFPKNIPLPSPKTSARITGGVIHFLHLCINASHESDNSWDSLSRSQSDTWFDWTTPITILLMSLSVLNTYNLSTRTKHYQFLRRQDPISSPNAKFIVTEMDLERLERPSWGKRIRLNLWYALSLSWRFLLGMQLPHAGPAIKETTSKVQELEIWTPGEMETELFSIYSPAHALLWLAIGSTNWILSILIMGLVGLQLNVLSHAYTQLLKDKQILAAETMKEYNEVFVYPRINPIRRDVAVMTHQSEVVNVWER